MKLITLRSSEIRHFNSCIKSYKFAFCRFVAYQRFCSCARRDPYELTQMSSSHHFFLNLVVGTIIKRHYLSD